MKSYEKPEDAGNAADVRRVSSMRAYFLFGSGLVLIPFCVVAIISEKFARGIVILVWAAIGVGIGTWRLSRQRPGEQLLWPPDAARATAEFHLHELGWTEVTVDPLTDNDRAIRAFARAGFIAERESRDDETGKPCLNMVMRRSTAS
jgi:hypothetical protein